MPAPSAASARTSTSWRRPAGLTTNAIEEGRARGQGQMPALLLDGEDAKHVAEYIAEVAGR